MRDDLVSNGDSIAPGLGRLLLAMVADWRSGDRRPISDYLARQPELAEKPEAILELINQEIALRLEYGESPRISDYLADHPSLSDELDRLFVLHAMASAMGDGAPTRSSADVRLPVIPGYEVERRIGRGGMGVVYLARDLALKRRVALKLLNDPARENPAQAARLRREAEAAARCQHPNLVPIYEVGEYEGETYLAMEYVEGENLGVALAGESRPPRQAAELVEAMARAIDHAHAKGVIHRDLKPSNVLLDAEGRPRIADFGLAKLRDATTETEVGAVLGTLAYLAPEQARAGVGEVGPKADIHALGVILYEILTGRRPYRGATPEQALHAILREPVVPPSTRRPGIPRDLEAICLKCLQKDPAHRYATAADLAEDLQRFLDGRPTLARPLSAAGRAARWGRQNRVAVAVIAALAILSTLSAWQAARATSAERLARTEARQKELINTILVEGILGQGGRHHLPIDQWSYGDLQVRTALDIGAREIDAELQRDPVVEAAVRLAIGESYRNLGLSDLARPQLERALSLRTTHLGARHPDTLIVQARLGRLLVDDHPDEAEPMLTSALDDLAATLGSDHTETLAVTAAMGWLRFRQGKHDESRALLERTVGRLQTTLGPANPRTLDAVEELAVSLLRQGQTDEARRVTENTFRLLDEPSGAETRAKLVARSRLLDLIAVEFRDSAWVLREGEALISPMQRVLGRSDPATLATIARLSTHYQVVERFGGAAPMLEEALAECRKAIDRNRGAAIVLIGNLSAHRLRHRDVEGSKALLIEAQDLTRALDGPDAGTTSAGNHTLVQFLLLFREHAAERPARELLAYLQRNAPESSERSIAEAELGYCLLFRRSRDEGEAKRFHAEGEAMLDRAFRAIRPDRPDLNLALSIEYRRLLGLVGQWYEEAGDAVQAATWKARLLDFGFPDNPFGT